MAKDIQEFLKEAKEADDHDLLVSMNVKMDLFCKNQADHEKRIRFLETWVWKSIGGLAIITVGSGIIFGFITIFGNLI